MLNVKTGALIALAAGSLFAAACNKTDDLRSSQPSADKTAKVHCQGVNECKGKGGCKSEKNACAGHNGCKGRGFVETSTDDCTAKGGTVMASAEK